MDTKKMFSAQKDVVLTTAEAIEYLKISKPTFFKCVRLGKIRATKVGKGWRVLLSELHRFLLTEENQSKELVEKPQYFDAQDE